jgi:hypothetical protein
MSTIWIYVITFSNCEPFIQAEFPTYEQCHARQHRGMPAYDAAHIPWASGCVLLEHGDWTFVRAHR